MNQIKFFPKQLQVFREGNDKKMKIFVGAVRSGKSGAAALEAVNMAVTSATEREPVIFIAKTLANAHYNICEAVRKFFGVNYLPETSPKATEVRLLGRRVVCVGASSAAQVEKVRGWNISGVIADEISTFHEDVFQMLLTRLDASGGKLVGTTNPEGPNHWLKKKFLDKNLDSLYHAHFSLDDNPNLSEEYKLLLRETLHGAFFKRYYLGEWANAENIVYSDFCEDHVGYYDGFTPDELICGVDFGLEHKTVAVLVAKSNRFDPPVVVQRALYIEQTPDSRETCSVVAERIFKWLAPNFPSVIYIDPSAITLRNEFYRWAPRGCAIKVADNDVTNGIHFICRMLARREIGFDSQGCKDLINEMYSYSWDVKKCERSGKDIVKKENDDGVDALRYALYSHFGGSMDIVQEARRIADAGMMAPRFDVPHYKKVLQNNSYGIRRFG